MDKIEVTDAEAAIKLAREWFGDDRQAHRWALGDSIAQAIATARAQGHRAGMIEAAGIASGFGRNRDWVPKSLYETLRREVAAAILAAAEEK